MPIRRTDDRDMMRAFPTISRTNDGNYKPRRGEVRDVLVQSSIPMTTQAVVKSALMVWSSDLLAAAILIRPMPINAADSSTLPRMILERALTPIQPISAQPRYSMSMAQPSESEEAPVVLPAEAQSAHPARMSSSLAHAFYSATSVPARCRIKFQSQHSAMCPDHEKCTICASRIP